MIPRAEIEHQGRGRARLRIPLKRRDPAYFETVCKELARLNGVTAVHGNARTAGVLIEWQGEEPDFVAYAGERELFEAVPHEGPADLRAAVARGLDRLNRNLSQVSGGRLDNRSVGFVALASFAAVQLVRGAILPPAITLLIHALELVDGREPASSGRQERSR